MEGDNVAKPIYERLSDDECRRLDIPIGSYRRTATGQLVGPDGFDIRLPEGDQG